MGDINNDGKVDLTDAILVLRILTAATGTTAAGINQDGKIGLDDAIYILQIVTELRHVEEASHGSFTNSLGMTFNLIPAGTFMMGSPPDELERSDNETLHQVTLTKPFYMQTTEVTHGQWEAVMGTHGSYFPSCGDDCPVVQVSWQNVQVFITELNKRGEGVYRLPTEAEWEYAARAGTTTPFNTGNCLSTDKANYHGAWSPYTGCPPGVYRGTPVPVESFPPNAWGLYDMHGNVWEWVQDWFGDYPTSAVTDPTGPASGAYRVLRGGSWANEARYCRSAFRSSHFPNTIDSDIGFRLVGQFAGQFIVVQPSPGLNDGTDDGSVNAGKDAYISNSYPNSNFNVNELMTGVYTWGSGSNCYSIIQFNLEGLPSNPISAKLYLRNIHYGRTDQAGHYRTGNVYGYRITEDWCETEVTWNSKPSHDPVVISESGEFDITLDEWIALDITSLYNNWKSGSHNYGILLNTDGSDEAGSCMGNREWNCRPGSFYSSDAETSLYRPRLVVQY